MSRWEEMAAAFQAALHGAALHRDPKVRREALDVARRLLQQFTAAGNVAIEGLKETPNVGRPRLPYKED